MTNVLVTAGPTREPIDPVRYISNRSSGKMGYAIAEAFAGKSFDVRLISGPSNCSCANKSISIIDVETAEQMQGEVYKNLEWANIIIMAAAVSDYRPVSVSAHKIKKNNELIELKLEKTMDILEIIGQEKKEGQVIVGFALETSELEENAKEKLARKNLDLVIGNSQKVIGSDTGEFLLVNKDGKKEKIVATKKGFANILTERLLPTVPPK